MVDCFKVLRYNNGMKTLTLTHDEANIVYDAVREALDLAYLAVEDTEVFPAEYTEEEVAEAQAKVASLEALLDTLAK